MSTELEVRQRLVRRYGDGAIKFLEIANVEELNSILATFDRRLGTVKPGTNTKPTEADVEKSVYTDIIKAAKINWAKRMAKEAMLKACTRGKIRIGGEASFTPDELMLTWYANREMIEEIPNKCDDGYTFDEIFASEGAANRINIYMVEESSGKSYLYACANWDGEKIVTMCGSIVPQDTVVIGYSRQLVPVMCISTRSGEQRPAGSLYMLNVWVRESESL